MRRSQLLAAIIIALASLIKSVAPILADSLPPVAQASAPASTPQGYRPIAGQGWTFAVPPDWQTTNYAANGGGDRHPGSAQRQPRTNSG